MDDVDIKPLIKSAVREYSGDERVERVILDMLRETIQEQHHGGSNWKKRFDKRLMESILAHFKGDMSSE